MVVGEAPASVEVARRKPFVGPSGGKLAEWWRRPDVNIQRRDCYITNVFPYVVNKIPRGGVHGIATTIEEWNRCVTALHQRLSRLAQPILVVAVGDIALQALRGHSGVLKWRGSLLRYEPLDVRLVPTVHPAALFRDPTLERRCIADWVKIARELKTPSEAPTRVHHIAPDWHEVRQFQEKVIHADHKSARLVIDIETPRRMKTIPALTPKLKKPTTKKVPGLPFIGCIGFALSPEESITIPTMKGYWTERGIDMVDVWTLIDRICQSRVPKILQNGFFDAFHLLRDKAIHKALGRGIRLRNWKHDTLAKHHVLEPTEDHDLGYLNSRFGCVPFWKDEGKQAGDLRAVPPDLEQWWRYNGKDCTEEHFIDAALSAALRAAGREDFYRDHYQKCFAPILQMMEDGMLVDEDLRQQRAEEIDRKLAKLRVKIEAASGVPLMGLTSISSAKLKEYLYKRLKLPVQTAKNARKEKVVSAGEIQLKKLMLRFPENAALQRVGKLVLKFRRLDKLRMFFAEKTVDKDGRTRASITFETDTGRLSMRKNPMGTGLNFQAFDHEAREIYVADPGGVFIEGDLSQAESRIVYVLTGDEELIEVARRPPWEYDSHTENTARILGIPECEVTKDQRKHIGKPTAHASHYGQMGPTMSDTMLRHGVTMTPDECQRHINAYMTWRHQIPKWHQKIKWQVIDQRQIVNSWGRVMDFSYMRLEPHLYQKAFNCRPQSEVGGLINQYGMIPIHRAIRTEGRAHRLRLQVHDALLYWSPWDVENVWWLMQAMKMSLERPRSYDGVELMIPVEFKIGLRWGSRKGCTDVIEFKQPPTKRQVRDALEMLRSGAECGERERA